MLRFFYLILAIVLCIGLAVLGLWPWAIKPRIHSIITSELEAAYAAQGIMVRASEFNITGLSEIELVSARVEDVKKHWSIVAPLVTLRISPLALLIGTQPLRKVFVTNPVILGEISDASGKKPQFNLPAGLAEISIKDGFAQVELKEQNASFRVESFNVTLKKRLAQYRIKIGLDKTWLELSGRSVDLDQINFSGALSESGKVIMVDARSFDAQAKESTVVASGTLVFDSKFHLLPKTQVHFKAHGDLAFGALFANGEAHISPAGQLISSGRLGARDLNFEDVTIQFVDAGFNFHNDILSILGLEASLGGTLVRADAQIEPKKDWRASLVADFKRLSLYDMLTDIGIRSVWVDMGLDGRIEAQGNLWPHFRLQGDAHATGNKFVVADRKARNLRRQDIILELPGPIALKSRIDVDTKAFRFIDAVITDGALSSAKVACTLYFDEIKGIEARVESDHVDFRSINNKIGDQTYFGSGRVIADVRGPYEHIVINGSTSVKNFTFENIAFGSVDAKVAYKGDDLFFKEGSIDSAYIHAKGELGINFARDVAISLKTPTFEAKLPQAFEALTQLPIKGTLRGSLDVKGPASFANGHKLLGSISIRASDSIVIQDISLDNFALDARATSDEWIIDLANAHVQDGVARVLGSIHKKDLDANLRFELGKMPLGYDEEAFLDSTITLRGRLEEPSISGKITVSDFKTPLLSLGSHEITLESSGRGRVKLDGALLSAKARLTGEIGLDLNKRKIDVSHVHIKSMDGDDIELNGEINPTNSQIDVTAQINLESLKLANENIDTIRGTLQGNVTLSGNILDPTLSGKGNLRAGHLMLAQMATPIDNITGSFSFEGKELVVNSAFGKCGQGTIEGRGHATFSEYSTKELEGHLLIKSFPLPGLTFLLGSASGFLDIRKLDNDMSVAGDLRIKDAYVTSDLKLEDLKFNSGFSSATKPVRLDVRLRTDSPIRVDTDFLTGELDANLHLVGTQMSPGLVGFAELKTAQASFRNNEYQLQKARIDFDDTFRIVPRLDVFATGQVDNYLIQARLQGTPDRPQLHLTSDPFLPESQLLVLMSLGYVADDIKGFATTARTTGLEALSMYLGVGHNLLRFLNTPNSSDFLRLEDLSLSSLFSKTDGVSLPAVRLGMNVGAGIKLRIHSSLIDNDAGKREQRVELEQSLGQRMKWRFGWDSDGLSNYGDAGIDLWYRWELN